MTAYFEKVVGIRTFIRRRVAKSGIELLEIVNEMEKRGHKLLVVYSGSEKIEL